MSNVIDINKIQKILPHRYPFLLVDRVLDYTIDEKLTAIKNVSMNEPQFTGHFPHKPVMPGVLILEAMAQAAAILASLGLGAEASDSTVYLFAGADKVRFKRQVEPGDQLLLEATHTQRKRNIWKMSVKASVDGQLVASGEILFTYINL